MNDEISVRSPATHIEKKTKILLVDDVELFLELGKTFFRREGVDLLVASSGEEALKIITSEQPDLVFLDLYMPGLNGDEVCRSIKQNNGHRNTPVIMVIQSGSSEDEQKCRDAGCDDILYKPVHKDAFIATAGRNLLTINQRDYPRVDASIKISFGLHPKKFLENFSINISQGGLFIATGAILAIGTQLNVEFRLPGGKEKIWCLGCVSWVNHPDWMKIPKLPVGMGVEFIDTRSEHMELLYLFVDQQTSAMIAN